MIHVVLLVLLAVALVGGGYAVLSSPLGKAIADRVRARGRKELHQRVDELEERVDTLENVTYLDADTPDPIEGG